MIVVLMLAMFFVSITLVFAEYSIDGWVRVEPTQAAEAGRARLYDAQTGGTLIDLCCLDYNAEFHFTVEVPGTYWIQIDTATWHDEDTVSAVNYKYYRTNNRVKVEVIDAGVRQNIDESMIIRFGLADTFWLYRQCKISEN